MAAETVFVIPNRGASGSRPRFHTDEDCHRLERAETVRSKERSLVESHRKHCKVCSGEFERHSHDGDTKELHDLLLETDPDAIGDGEASAWRSPAGGPRSDQCPTTTPNKRDGGEA